MARSFGKANYADGSSSLLDLFAGIFGECIQVFGSDRHNGESLTFGAEDAVDAFTGFEFGDSEINLPDLLGMGFNLDDRLMF